MSNALVNAFRKLSVAMILNSMKSDSEVADSFNLLSPSKRRELEREIERKAELIANCMFRKLQEQGLIENDPSPNAIVRLFEEALRENEQA